MLYGLRLLWYNVPGGGETMALSEKKKASNARWDSVHLKRLSVAIPAELFTRLQAAVNGGSVNGFIRQAIEEKIAREAPEK